MSDMTYYKDRWTPYRVDFAGYSVLVVEDDPVVRRTLVQTLRAIGFFRISQVADGTRALAVLRAGEPVDVVVSDIAMQPMDGVTFLASVREVLPEDRRNIPVLFISGHGDRETVAKAVRLRPAGYILKPAQPEQLSQRLAGALGLSAAAPTAH